MSGKRTQDKRDINGYPMDLRIAVRRFTQAHIQRALELHEGNITKTAKALGMSRRSIQLKLRGRRDKLSSGTN
jgi:ActR/RegA family two-component response regulator